MTRAIFMLQYKITIITEVLNERDGTHTKPPQFAKDIGQKYSSLKSAWRRKRLSPDLELAIAAAADFDPDDRSWYDPSRTKDEDNAGRIDDGDSFRRMLRKKHGLTGADSRRLVDDGAKLLDPDMADFNLSDAGQASSPGIPANIFMSLSMNPRFIADKLAFGFKGVRLALVLEKPGDARFCDQLGGEAPAPLGTAVVRSKGNHHRPIFEITANEGAHVLAGEFETKDAPLCAVTGMSIEDTVKAELSVNVFDGSLVRIDGNELPSKNKEQVIKQLMKKRLNPDSEGTGRVVVGIQRVTMVRV
ncbi:hypothetical protein ACC740_33070 [Rhizobium ruizarguesonis]